MCIASTEEHLMESLSGILVMNLLGMFKFLMLVMFNHLILIFCYKDFLALSQWDTFGFNGNFGAPEKKFSINFSKAKTKFGLNLHYNGENNYLFGNGEKIYKFNAINKNVSFQSQFCLGSTFNKFGKAPEASLNKNVYDFSIVMTLLIDMKY